MQKSSFRFGKTTFSSDKFLYQIGRSCVQIYSWIFIRTLILNAERIPEGPQILVANHPSTMDPGLITLLIQGQASILVRAAVFDKSIWGSYLKSAGIIPVTPGRGKEALARAEEVLHDGKSIIIFPEGTISPTEGGFHRPRTGAIRLALATGATLVPVGIALEKELIVRKPIKFRHEEITAVWYPYGNYCMNIGDPMYLSGDHQDREYVKKLSTYLMSEVTELAEISDKHVRNVVDKYPHSKLKLSVFSFLFRLLTKVAL